MTGQPETKPPFRAVLSPNCSLTPNGFAIVMGVIALISFAAGMVFLMIGAWPVLGFFGLDVAIIYWAFRRNFRDAERREIIEVTEQEVIVQRLAPGRLLDEQRFTRPWVRLALEQDEKRELIGPLTLNQSGRRLEIGAFLGSEERLGFYQALNRALAGS